MRLSLDPWSGNKVSFAETNEPSRKQVSDALDQLDGKTHTELSIKRDDPFEYLSVSGGPNLFLVNGETREGDFIQLHNPSASDGFVELVCGGQIGRYNLRDVVSREHAESAVNQFIEGLPDQLPEPWSTE